LNLETGLNFTDHPQTCKANETAGTNSQYKLE